MTNEQMKRIWAAKLQRMLLDATGEVLCYQGGSQERERFRTQAIAWFKEGSHDFHATCEAAGFNPAVVQTKALKLIEEHRQETLQLRLELALNRSVGKVA